MWKLKTAASAGGQTPAAGDTIRVYDAGTTTLVSGLVEPKLTNPQPISNPIVVAGDFWGFQCPDSRLIDVWWEEGNRYLLQGVPVRHLSLDLGTAAYRDVGTQPGNLLEIDAEGGIPLTEIDLETADKYKVAGQPLLNVERVGPLAPVQSVNGLTGAVITNTTEYPNIPRRVYFVYGDSSDGGTTPDATTQASINALVAAGIPTNNIRWLYEVDDGSGGTLIVQSIAGGGTIDNVTLSLAGGVLSVNSMSGGGTVDNVVLTNASGGTLSVANLAGGGTIDNITLVLAGGLLSVDSMSGGGTIDNVTLVEQGGGEPTYYINEEFNNTLGVFSLVSGSVNYDSNRLVVAGTYRGEIEIPRSFSVELDSDFSVVDGIDAILRVLLSDLPGSLNPDRLQFQITCSGGDSDYEIPSYLGISLLVGITTVATYNGPFSASGIFRLDVFENGTINGYIDNILRFSWNNSGIQTFNNIEIFKGGVGGSIYLDSFKAFPI